jgi:hypothetical protein
VGWIFRTGDSKRAKQITLAFLFVLAIDVYGGFNRLNFVPTAVGSSLAVSVSAVLTFLFILALWFDTNPVARFNRYGAVRRLLAIAFSGTLFFGATWMGALYGLTSAFTNLGGESFLTVPKAAVSLPERTGRGCHHQVMLELGALDKPAKPCVSEETWSHVKSGGRVSVALTSSLFGTQIADVKIKRGG